MEMIIPAIVKQIAEQGIVFAMFVISTYVLVMVIRVLYKRNQDMGDAFLKAITDHTTAMNNLANKIENMKGP